MLFVDTAHQGSGGREDLIYEDEDSLLGRELYALANDIDKLAYGEIGGNKVFLLVDGSDIRLLNLLTDDLYGESVSDRRGGEKKRVSQGADGA